MLLNVCLHLCLLWLRPKTFLATLEVFEREMFLIATLDLSSSPSSFTHFRVVFNKDSEFLWVLWSLGIKWGSHLPYLLLIPVVQIKCELVERKQLVNYYPKCR